ncbi:MAG: hypothetical protein JO228_16895, partial [Xanthobacteraceae bacterium]|nr:hypothetical protein [Xanthobacteraceae bacterium]
AKVLATAGKCKEALDIIEREKMDAALLDANLRGDPVDEIAAALMNRKIPFLFVTGHEPDSLPPGFRHVSVVSKPFSQTHLLKRAAGLVHEGVGGRLG